MELAGKRMLEDKRVFGGGGAGKGEETPDSRIGKPFEDSLEL